MLLRDATFLTIGNRLYVMFIISFTFIDYHFLLQSRSSCTILHIDSHVFYFHAGLLCTDWNIMEAHRTKNSTEVSKSGASNFKDLNCCLCYSGGISGGSQYGLAYRFNRSSILFNFRTSCTCFYGSPSELERLGEVELYSLEKCFVIYCICIFYCVRNDCCYTKNYKINFYFNCFLIELDTTVRRTFDFQLSRCKHLGRDMNNFRPGFVYYFVQNHLILSYN